jgi:hypothetical protein
MSLSGPVAAEDTPQFVTESEFRDTAEDEESAQTDDDRQGEGSGESNEPPESAGTQNTSGTAELGESVTKNNLFYLALMGAHGLMLNYERIFGDWTAGGGMFLLPVPESALFALRVGATRSVLPAGRHNLLIQAGGVLYTISPPRCDTGSNGETTCEDGGAGLYGGIAYEYRRYVLFRIELDIIMASYEPVGMVMFDVLGVPVIVNPGVSIGFAF